MPSSRRTTTHPHHRNALPLPYLRGKTHAYRHARAPGMAASDRPIHRRLRNPEMLNYAILIFAIAAIGGLILASSVLRNKLAPWALSIVHALLGAAGLVVLIVMALGGSAPGRLTAALGLLVLAALGGFFLASFHMRNKIAPKAVVFVHAGVAVIGFLTLLSLLLH
jgi:hypothetical protein